MTAYERLPESEEDQAASESSLGASLQAAQTAVPDVGIPEYAFSGVDVKSPLQELEQVWSRRALGLKGSADGGLAARLGRAHDIARQHLERSLGTDPVLPIEVKRGAAGC
jgi:hypothetical protein